MSKKANANKMVNEVVADENANGAVETIIVEGAADDVENNSVDNTADTVDSDADTTDTSADNAGQIDAADAVRQITELLQSGGDTNAMLAKVLQVASLAVDESKLPADQCSDAELLRRLKLVWSRKTMAKKAGELDKLAQLEADEQYLSSLRTKKVNRGGVVTSDVDPSKLSQSDLTKLIRNYQSKKCTAKKAMEAAVADGNTEEATKQAGLVEHWQAKVDDASKYRTTTPAQAKVSDMTKRINEAIAGLEALPKTPEIEQQIAALKALV
jgi:hypothetical protein